MENLVPPHTLLPRRLELVVDDGDSSGRVLEFPAAQLKLFEVVPVEVGEPDGTAA